MCPRKPLFAHSTYRPTGDSGAPCFGKPLLAPIERESTLALATFFAARGANHVQLGRFLP